MTGKIPDKMQIGGNPAEISDPVARSPGGKEIKVDLCACEVCGAVYINREFCEVHEKACTTITDEEKYRAASERAKAKAKVR